MKRDLKDSSILAFPPSSPRGLCGTENDSRTRHSCLKTELSVRCTENSIFPTSQDGLRANGTRAMVQALAWPRCWESRSVCFCVRKPCSTNAHGLTESKALRSSSSLVHQEWT